MIQRTLIATMLFVGGLLVVLAKPLAIGQPLSQGLPAQGCESRINTWERRDLVPSHALWEEAFTALASDDQTIRRRVNLAPDAFDKVSTAAKRTRARLTQIHADLAVAPFARYAEAAENVLNVRDDLIRTLAQPAFDALNDVVADLAVTHSSYVLAVKGKYVDDHGLQKCAVIVKAEDYPHVVPESALWEVYFETMGPIATRKRTKAGKYPDDLILGLRAHHLNVSPFYVATILDATILAKSGVDGLREANSQPSVIAAAVMTARADLVRSLPISVWSALNREVARLTGGTIYSFPLTF
jgi:hypothetical protein